MFCYHSAYMYKISLMSSTLDIVQNRPAHLNYNLPVIPLFIKKISAQFGETDIRSFLNITGCGIRLKFLLHQFYK